MKATDAPMVAARSRRAVLAAAASAAAASAAATLARPLSAAAADGDPLILGQQNQADTNTTLDGALIAKPFLMVENAEPGLPAALIGRSLNGTGVYGQTEGNSGVVTGSASAGVYGTASTPGAIGVVAVNGNLTGTGLWVQGKVKLRTRSGRATVRAGRSSVDIDLTRGGLDGTPLCFANLMSYRPGVFVTTVRPNYPVVHKARIYLNRTVSSNTHVAWFVLN